MKARFIAFFPFAIFLFVFSLLTYIYAQPNVVRDNFPLCAAFIAIIASFYTFNQQETFNKRVEIFIQGSTQSIVIHMCYIFYISTVFTTILEQTGGIAAAVAISLYCIPNWCILPGIFIITSLFSFTVGTSMGAIAAFMPIAIDIAHHLAINPSLMAAIIVSGAMFGDNLSILSDTTITAVNITGCDMKEKFLLNAKIALPAFIGSLFCLMLHNYYSNAIAISSYGQIQLLDCIKIIPYIVTFYTPLTGLDIIIVLILGIISALSIGLVLKTITLLQAVNLLFDGFYISKSMVNVFMLVLFLAGLSHIIHYNGGIEYVINYLKNKVLNARHGKFAIFLLISSINSIIAINTIAILMTGPIAKKISVDYRINPTETACILDIGSCVSQGLLPYAPQLLLAASIAQVSALSLLPFLYYQYFLGLSLFCFMILGKEK